MALIVGQRVADLSVIGRVLGVPDHLGFALPLFLLLGNFPAQVNLRIAVWCLHAADQRQILGMADENAQLCVGLIQRDSEQQLTLGIGVSPNVGHSIQLPCLRLCVPVEWMQECVDQLRVGHFIRESKQSLKEILELHLAANSHGPNVGATHIHSVGKRGDGPAREPITQLPVELLEFLEGSTSIWG